jgi:hypothetical protein
MSNAFGDQSTTFAKLHISPRTKIAGPGSASIKYDIVTALLAASAHEAGPKARLALRLTLVITARFNWRLGHFAVGQKQLAQMWGVTERTAKREIAHLRALGWIRVEKAAARGRVAQHSIEFPAVLRDTRPYWAAVGPDFAARMSGLPEDSVQTPDNIVPMRMKTVSVPAQDGTLWPKMAAHIEAAEPDLFAAWLCGLTELDFDGGTLVLGAPTRFIAGYVETHHKLRLLAIATMLEPTLRNVKVIAVA